MRHICSDVSRLPGRIARPVMLCFSLVLIVALIAGEVCSARDVVNSLPIVFFQADDNCRVGNEHTPVRCDQLAHRFRAEHVKSDTSIVLVIDNAKYETVVKTLDMFRKAGFADVDVFPPMGGTNLSSKVKRWIRIRVEGASAHPFAMLLITTEQLRTWREEVLVLSAERYEVVDHFIRARMLQPDCKDLSKLYLEPPYSHTISLTEHNADRSQACVIPPGESCEWLSELMGLSDVNWTDTEKQTVMDVRSELRCKNNLSHS